jgi:hypothetical protein
MAMQDLSTIIKRDGAFYWGLFRHDKKENVYVESFLVDSWVEHLRQHERMTVAIALFKNMPWHFILMKNHRMSRILLQVLSKQ